MSSSSNISQWKFINHFRRYLSKNTGAPSAPGSTKIDEAKQKLKEKISDLSDKIPEKISDLSDKIPEKISDMSDKIPEKISDLSDSIPEKIQNKISSTDTEKSSSVSWKRALVGLNAYIPQILPSPQPPLKKDVIPAWRAKKKITISKSSVDARTRHLLSGLLELPDRVLAKRMSDICIHLRTYPFTKNTAVKAQAIPQFLKILHTYKPNSDIEGNVRESLALVGYSGPLKGRGINILSIDGGGIRGLVAVELLKELEVRSGKKIHELFDFICGVSTGAILANLLGVRKLSVDECLELYQKLSLQIFSQTKIKGTAGLVWKSSFYDSEAWADVLKNHAGTESLTETTREEGVPKICTVATQVNSSLVKGFLFRNYAIPCRMGSQYEGCHTAKIWECIRASAAAPGYFSEFRVDDTVLVDGGLLVNNPTAIGVHEAKLLWPDAQIQTVVSLGTGRHDCPQLTTNENVGWGARIKTIINSATDTEGIHTAMNDLLPVGSYYRLNPYLSEPVDMDEIAPEKLSQLQEDTKLYIRRNDQKIANAVGCITCTKNLMDKFNDYWALNSLLKSARQ